MKLKLETVEKISRDGRHNAFTDLIFFNGWWCAYRSASHHMSFDGKIIVLFSEDAIIWQPLHVISWQGGDLRDPKFYITPESGLCLTAGIRSAVHTRYQTAIASISYLVSKARFELLTVKENDLETWRWSPTTYNNNSAYSVGYAAKDIRGCLYFSEKPGLWKPLVRPFFPVETCFCNEASLVFSKNSQKAYCLLRTDGQNCTGFLGQAEFPFTDWQWNELAVYLGGPKLLELSNSELIASYRIIEAGEAKTVISVLDIDNASLKVLLELPSGGDCSYPGLVEKDQNIYLSYYSSHEKNTQVYLAKISFSN